MERCASVDGVMDTQTPREGGGRGEGKTKLHKGNGGNECDGNGNGGRAWGV
jgi:hypothetical protein